MAKGSPVLVAQDDVYTNHIHANDLARICVAAMWRGKPGRVLHASDRTEMRMGTTLTGWPTATAPRPPRITMDEARRTMTVMQLSFWSESRRLVNDRLYADLRLSLRYPTVKEGLGQD